MPSKQSKLDVLIDDFVQYANDSGLEPKFPTDLPEDLRGIQTDLGTFHWQIRPASSNAWVADIESRLPQKFPVVFRSLIERYRFADFEVGPIMFFANTGEALFKDLSTNAFRDKGLFPTLHKNGFLEFGKRSGGWYDPICFDMKRRKQDDAPVVQLDHEEILIHSRIRVVNEISTSFAGFCSTAMLNKLTVH